MKTLFVATVGMGTGLEVDIVPPLINSIRESNPDCLLLFVTEDSKKNGEEIVRQLCRSEGNSRVHQLRAERDDIEEIFKEMLDVLRGIMKQHHISPEDVTADFTTGLKTMSAALALSAVQLGFSRLKYIAVKRDEQRKVIPGTERFKTLIPRGIWDSISLQTAISLMEHYRFVSALNILEQLPLLSTSEERIRQLLTRLANAYLRWDLFNHRSFASNYRLAEPDLNADQILVRFKVSKETIDLVDQIGNSKEITDLMIVDLINNAKRRIKEGRYDDAVARLYRACEMIAQWRLKEAYGINTSDVDLDRVPEKSRDWLNHCRSRENKIVIGLQKSYRLMMEMGDELGAEYDPLVGLLKERNESILAHGIKPVEGKTAHGMFERISHLAERSIADYERKRELLKFPF
jgi:CRISPR-associated protein (TIGR02710 family)